MGSVHWRMFSTYGGVQYIRTCLVHWGVFSTSEDVQYIGGYSVHQRDIMIHVGGYHKYTGGFSTLEGYQEYIGGTS